MSLKNKTLFITGGSRGIGLAIALRAARNGANVAIAAKTDDPVNTAVAGRDSAVVTGCPPSRARQANV